VIVESGAADEGPVVVVVGGAVVPVDGDDGAPVPIPLVAVTVKL
jgi:hypothetical protein